MISAPGGEKEGTAGNTVGSKTNEGADGCETDFGKEARWIWLTERGHPVRQR